MIKLIVIFAFFLFNIFQNANAQGDPRQFLAGMIAQVQTGQLNPQWYGQQLWQTIASQTGNTGVYPSLVQLGAVQNVVVNQQQQLPQGWLFSMTAQHTSGQSTWLMGINSLTSRIEYASFNIGNYTSPLPNPQPNPQPNPTPNPSPLPGSDSDACRKFPNLC